ncbi:MAG: hypothetical protein ACKV22_05635 [Bryobacteraceae bacterium]
MPRTLLTLAFASILAAQSGGWVRHPFGQGSIDVPAGWKVESRTEGGVVSLQAHQDPDDGAAPALMVYRSPVNPYQSADQIVQGMVKGSPGTRVTRQEKVDEGQIYYFTYPLDGAEGQGAFLVQPGVVVAFTGSKARFTQAGGSAVPRRAASSLRWPGAAAAAPSPAGTAVSPSAPSVPSHGADFAGQFIPLAEVVLRSPRFAVADLPGVWGEGQGSVVTQVRQRRIDENTLEEISRTTGTQGKARIIRFLPNQRYQWLTTTEVSSTGCRSQSSITENGSWQFDGITLVVTPQQYDGMISICGDRERQRGSNAPVRRYHASEGIIRRALGSAGDPTRRALLLAGPCAKHLADCGYTNQVEIILQKF